MAYARFSPTSDLYVYPDESGVAINVASRRPVFHPDHPLPETTDGTDDPSALREKYRLLSEAYEYAEFKPIGAGHDGEGHHVSTGEEAARLVAELAETGYQVPDGLVEALREDEDDSPVTEIAEAVGVFRR